MTIYSILEKVLRLWNMRIAVLSSLCFQIVLIFLAPLRKRTRRIWVNAIIWFCYLMADWVAIYAIGVIVNHSRCSFDDGKGVDRDLAAFWAPFLLLHLGGPDTITAFSIEDNRLWMRHFLSMMVEVVVVFYVLLLAIPSNVLWLPFLLVFVAGTIKYAERTLALYLACYGNINESWSSADSMADSMKNYGAPHKDNEPDNYSESDENRAEEYHMVVFLQAAYRLYKISRKIIYSQIFDEAEAKESFELMFELEPEKAFNVVAVELSFIYDELFTKMAAVHRGGWFGYFSRLICSASIVSAFVLFSTTKKLKVPHNVDMAVTYALLVGAIFLDFIAVIMLVFSDRAIAFLKDCPKASKVIHSMYRKMNCYNSDSGESISQHNFINYWMKSKRGPRTRFEGWFQATIKYFGLTTAFEELRYKYDMNVSRELKRFIYDYLKGLHPDDTREIISSRCKTALSEYLDRSIVVKWSVEMEYGRSLFNWHIATDYLYHSGEGDIGDTNHREICKVLSDYMFYIYRMRPSLISIRQGAVFQSRFDVTCEEIGRVLEKKEISGQKNVCVELLSKFEGAPETFEDDLDTLVVWESASVLANHLKRITGGGDKMWKVMSRVWMEMLCYGAYHSEGNAHAQQLGQGGEFITHVWLLMANFCFNDCIGFEILQYIERQQIDRIG